MALDKYDLEGLQQLLEETNQYVQSIFDWVNPLKHVHLLPKLYDFRRDIEAKIAELEALPDEDNY